MLLLGVGRYGMKHLDWLIPFIRYSMSFLSREPSGIKVMYLSEMLLLSSLVSRIYKIVFSDLNALCQSLRRMHLTCYLNLKLLGLLSRFYCYNL